jgi:Bacterial tandem repeat domain 1
MTKPLFSRQTSVAAPLALGAIILGFAPAGLTPAHAEHYAAIWDKSSGPAWVARHGLTSSTYQAGI